MRENPDCNYIVAYSQTRSIYHEFIAIFFLANIFCELLSIINPTGNYSYFMVSKFIIKIAKSLIHLKLNKLFVQGAKYPFL